jgi:transcription elongation factor
MTNGIFVDRTENTEIMGSEVIIDNNDFGTNLLQVNVKEIPGTLFPLPIENLRKLVGKSIIIIKGNWKGRHGVVRNMTEKLASVELFSKKKIITIDPSLITELTEDS